MNNLLKKRSVVVVIAVLLVLLVGTACGSLYLILVGRQVQREAEFHSYGNTKNPAVLSLLRRAFKSEFHHKDYAESLVFLQKAGTIEPENRAVRVKTAIMLLHCERYAEARALFTELAQTEDYFGKQARAFLRPGVFEKTGRRSSGSL